MLYTKTHDVHKTNVTLLKYLSEALTECAYLDSKPIPEESLLRLFDRGKVSAHSDEYGSVIFRVLCESHPLHSSVDVCPVHTTINARYFNENAPDIQLAVLTITVSDNGYGTGFIMEGRSSSLLFRISELQSNEHVGLFRLPMGGKEKATVMDVVFKQNPIMGIDDDIILSELANDYQNAKVDTDEKLKGHPTALGQLRKLCSSSYEINKQSKLMGKYKINCLALKLWLECYGLNDLTSSPTIKELTIGEHSSKLSELSLSAFAYLVFKEGVDKTELDDDAPTFTINEEGTLSFKHYSDEVNDSSGPLFAVLCYGIFAPKR